MWDFPFFANSVLLGVGLAMDAVSVSAANGMTNSGSTRGERLKMASIFGGFQMAMPLIGWAAVRTAAEQFELFRKAVPWISLALLCILGVKMIVEGVKKKQADAPANRTIRTLLLEGLATSLDALSVGFTIQELPWYQALTEAFIIGIVTFGLCLAAVRIGKAAGSVLRSAAPIVGGVILVVIGIEIFVKNVVLG
ncbi:MAG: manganese efflux pump [Clostridia bacterium]|nr:manganese efflux pump [Clostridia bacterium]